MKYLSTYNCSSYVLSLLIYFNVECVPSDTAIVSVNLNEHDCGYVFPAEIKNNISKFVFVFKEAQGNKI